MKDSLRQRWNFCNKYKLNGSEYDLLLSVYVANSGDNTFLAELVNNYKSQGINIRDLLRSLQEKKIINKTYKIPEDGEELDPYAIHINKIVTNAHMRSADALFNELYSLYPSFGTTSNGQWFPLRNLTKYYMDDRAAGLAYMKKIRGEYELHKEIIELVKWAKDETVGALKWTLTEFIGSGKWDELKEMKNRPELLNNFSDNLVDLN